MLRTLLSPMVLNLAACSHVRPVVDCWTAVAVLLLSFLFSCSCPPIFDIKDLLISAIFFHLETSNFSHFRITHFTL